MFPALRHQSVFNRRMLVDYIWHQELTEGERSACGGESGRTRIKGWVTSAFLDCPIDRTDILSMFNMLMEKN